MKQKVSDYVADFLADRGIRHVFGIIGAGNVRIFEAIAARGYTEIICVHHEQAACMAMQVYYRLTGQITASLLTTGAGSTNSITGIVSAWADSIPCVVISGNEASKHARADNPLRMWGVQGYDSTEMVSKVCKHVSRLHDPKDIKQELEAAFHIAGSGRPGPCWLDIPMDFQGTSIETDLLPAHTCSTELETQPETLQQAVAATLLQLKQAKRPVLWLGHGIRLAQGEALVKELVERLQVPALVSWAGIDMIDSDHPLVYGRAGVYGQRSANFILQNADLILTIGTRLAIPQIGYDLTELVRDGKIIYVDIDPKEFTKFGDRIALPICADAKLFIEALLAHVEVKSFTTEYPDWVAQCDYYRKKYPLVDTSKEHADTNGYINSYTFMERLNRHFKPDQVVVTDMGTALLSGHQVLKLKGGQRLMTSTGLGEMGYGLPGAIGASIARDKGEVMCLNCDGGMMMNLQELQTVVHHNLPIKLFIFNNDGYLMIKHTQKALFGKSSVGIDKASGVSCPDFSKLATAFGFPSYQIRTWKDFDEVLPKVQAHTGPIICEVFMDPQQPFLPKLSVVQLADGSLISPPLEDLFPFVAREELEKDMLVGIHPKSKQIVAE
jgi:acetolactate synthase-1/2/3 large subunit